MQYYYYGSGGRGAGGHVAGHASAAHDHTSLIGSASATRAYSTAPAARPARQHNNSVIQNRE